MSHSVPSRPAAASPSTASSPHPRGPMTAWLGRLMVAVLAVDVLLLTITALPTLAGGHLGGTVLLLHMMASGVMVALVPLTLWWFIGSARGRGVSATFLWFVTLASATIGSVFIVMLPIASTPVMEKAVTIHGWVGYATAIMGLFACFAVWRRRTVRSSGDPPSVSTGTVANPSVDASTGLDS